MLLYIQLFMGFQGLQCGWLCDDHHGPWSLSQLQHGTWWNHAKCHSDRYCSYINWETDFHIYICIYISHRRPSGLKYVFLQYLVSVWQTNHSFNRTTDEFDSFMFFPFYVMIIFNEQKQLLEFTYLVWLEVDFPGEATVTIAAWVNVIYSMPAWANK